ncbi:MAG: PTS sugar transporter subunit IIA [Phycisphaerales bacterium]|nr:PTS sugar transporter subunit IIA [Phycisphaerales bacterium]
MKLTDYLPQNLIKIPLQVSDKTQAITVLVDLLAEQGLTSKRDQLLQAVLERESQRTTGIGRGFAIPHAKCDAVGKLMIACGRPEEPIDFAAIDDQPVRLIALLVSPTNETSTHIQALAKLSRLVTNDKLLSSLLEAKDASEFHALISENDHAFSSQAE